MRASKRTFYLAGAGGMGNIGSEAILLAIVSFLQQKYPQSRFIVSCCYPLRIREVLKDLAGDFHIIKNEGLTFNPLLIKEADIFIVCGDIALTENVLTYLPLYWSLKTLTAKALGKKVIFLGIEADRLANQLNLLALKYIITQTTDYCIVRNSSSFANLYNYNSAIFSLLLGCEPTLILPDNLISRWQYNINRSNKRNLLVGLGVRDLLFSPLIFDFFKMRLVKNARPHNKISAKMQHVIAFTAQIADYLIDNYNADLLFIPHHYLNANNKVILNDIDIAKLIVDKMKNKSNINILDKNLHPLAVLSIYKGLDLVLSMRHHANAFAFFYNVPTIGFAIDNKIINFFKHINMPEMLIDPFRSKDDEVASLIDTTMANKDLISSHLNKTLNIKQNDLYLALEKALA